MISKERIVPIAYQVGLILAVVSMPFSNFGMSLASFWLLGTWIVDQLTADKKNLRYRWAKAVSHPFFWVLTSLFLLHVVCLVNTSDWGYALKDLRIKLPLLLFPVLFFTARPIEGQALRRMWLFFVLACGAAAAACLAIPIGLWDREVSNIRDISVFISHIRFSMLLVFSSAVMMLWISEGKRVWLSIVFLLINVAFLWVIESMTGTVLLIAVLILYMVSDEASVLKRSWRLVLRWSIPIVLLGIFSWVGWHSYDYFHLPKNHDKGLATTSRNGNLYEHHPDNTMRENGHFIWRYIAWGELRQGWEQRSKLPYDTLDARGQELYGTLVRYLSSKGLRKDLDGVLALSETDIQRIEEGIPSILEIEHNGLRRRLDKIFFEIANVMNGGNPGGNSVTQRLEFWKAAWHIIEDHPLFGVGTGDVEMALDQAYDDMESALHETYRLHPHNQYLTFWVAFGVLGVMLLLITLLMPIGVAASERGFLFTTFCLIIALSFVTEDTLETQAGVTFFAYFAALFSAQRLAFHSRIRSNT